MKVTKLLTRFLLAMSCMLIAVGVQAQEVKKPPKITLSNASLASRLSNLEHLVMTSSGARRIMASGNSEAMAKRDRAEDLLHKAQKNFDRGDLTAADRVLDNATKTMFEAIRLVGAGASTEQKKLHDFDDRAASVEVLLKALKRIASDKQVMHTIESKLHEFESKAARAQKMKNAGKVDGGRRLLDDAYVSAKAAIEGLRGGETLVRTLSFANKKEEFAYERDRNDTHKMLVKVLVEEKMKSSAGIESMVNKHLDKANKLRAKAESQAKAGDHNRAVSTMERSTKEILRAIRSAGVYIPG